MTDNPLTPADEELLTSALGRLAEAELHAVVEGERGAADAAFDALVRVGAPVGTELYGVQLKTRVSPRSGVVGTSTTWTPQGTCICDGLGSSLTCAAAVGLPRRNRPRSAGHYELSSPVGCESYLRCCPIPALSLPLIETLLITVVRLWERCNGSSRSWNGPDMSTQARMAGGCTAFATCSVDGSRLTHW